MEPLLPPFKAPNKILRFIRYEIENVFILIAYTIKCILQGCRFLIKLIKEARNV